VCLLNQAFRVPKGRSFLDDFPIWSSSMAKMAQSRKIGIFHQSQLVAAVGIRFADLKIEGSRLPIGLIGGVVTDPLWRGIGLASRLIQQATQLAKNFEVAGIFLWGSEHSFYKKLGFESFGSQARANLDSFPWVNLDPTIQIRDGWNENIFNFFQQRRIGLSILERDRPWLKAHRNVQWVWSGEPTRPSAFVCYGKGIDLYGMIHEWGGDPTEVKKILSYLKKVDSALQIIGPESELLTLGFEPSSIARETLCLANILDPSRVTPRVVEQFWFWGLDSA